jgi:pantoate--beta-alanine ligase
MKIVETISRMSTLVKIAKKEGKTIGFVPTMGYLHEGHLSLARAAKKHTDVVVMSIFVNPLQFGPNEDLSKYPRDFKRDEEMARLAGVDILFYPSEKEMYPEGYSTYVEVKGLSETLCGLSRPGHFKGVATIVAKLFGIVRPDIAYFGQKDAQQVAVIRKMASDLNMAIEIMAMPIVREKDGLAMSSRNSYLSESERKDASVLHQSLLKAESMIRSGEKDSKKLIRTVESMIRQKPSARIDYIAVVNEKDFKDMDTITGNSLVALAVFIGKTRLIDNIIVRKA